MFYLLHDENIHHKAPNVHTIQVEDSVAPENSFPLQRESSLPTIIFLVADDDDDDDDDDEDDDDDDDDDDDNDDDGDDDDDDG